MYEVGSRRTVNKSGVFFVLLILSALVLGTFYGCQLFSPKTEPVSVDDRVPMDRRIGILKSLGGVRTSNQGTHLLQLDDGSTILLKSLQINLDDENYLGKSVEVRGLLTYTTDSKPIMEVMNIDLVQTETLVAPESLSWKDFSGDTLGLEIKYRDDLKVDSTSQSKVVFSRIVEQVILTQETVETAEAGIVSESKPPVHEMSISREALGADETMLSNLGVKKGDVAELLSAGLSKSKIGSGNYEAMKKTDGDYTIYYLEAGKYVYTVKINCGNDEKTLADQNLFYEMLGTMKLAGASEAGRTQEVDVANDVDAAPAATTPATTEADTTTTAATTTSVTPAGAPTTMKNLPGGTDETDTAPSATTAGDVKTKAGTQEATTVSENAAVGTTQESQQVNDGFTTMDSTSFKFSVQYPKSWYYSGSASTQQDVIRHYEFGTKPLEEEPGTVSLDLMTGTPPSGSTSTVKGNTVTTVSNGGTVDIYVKGSGSRIYKISGPAGQQDTLLEIAGTVKD